eukprot:6327812-Amphidinium_carterae.1
MVDNRGVCRLHLCAGAELLRAFKAGITVLVIQAWCSVVSVRPLQFLVRSPMVQQFLMLTMHRSVRLTRFRAATCTACHSP